METFKDVLLTILVLIEGLARGFKKVARLALGVNRMFNSLLASVLLLCFAAICFSRFFDETAATPQPSKLYERACILSIIIAAAAFCNVARLALRKENNVNVLETD